MAVTPDLLLSPDGELEGWLFPHESHARLLVRLQKYIDAGASTALALDPVPPDLDAVVREYAYYRAYDAVVLRLSADPSKQEFTNQGRQEWSKEQLGAMVERRDGKAALLPPGMVPAVVDTGGEVVGDSLLPMTLVSQQVPTYIVWPR